MFLQHRILLFSYSCHFLLWDHSGGLLVSMVMGVTAWVIEVVGALTMPKSAGSQGMLPPPWWGDVVGGEELGLKACCVVA